MNYGSAASKKRSVAGEALAETPAARRRAASSEASSIQDNAFHRIMFDPSLDPNEKKRAIAAALVFSGTKEENRARIAEFEQFKEFLQASREEMASEIIQLTNTETFATMKDVYEEMNQGLIDFEDQMRPLTEILDAVYSLRSEGKTVDAFRSISEDRKMEAKLLSDIDRITSDILDRERLIRDTTNASAALAEERSFFGFGGIKENARKQIAAYNEEKGRLEAEKAALELKRAEGERQISALATTGDYAEAKAQLRKLLDISSDDHRENQKALVAAATNFVQKSKDSIGVVRQHLGDMSGTIENLYDSNQTMTRIYAILNESVKDAAEENQKIRAVKQAAPENESLIDKMRREEDKMAVEDHIKILDASAVDTLTSYGDLTSSSIQIKSMKDNNEDQINKAKQMHTQGVAGVASKLSVVLQAVSQAALGESSEMARDTIRQMALTTGDVAKKEVIRAAMGIGAQSDEIERAVESLASYGETVAKATEISRENLAELRERFGELEQLASRVQEDIKHDSSARADASALVPGRKVEKRHGGSVGLGRV